MTLRRILCLGMLAGLLAAGLAAVSANADCATSGCRADVSIYGSSNPPDIHPHGTTLLYFTAKDNGPAAAYGIQVNITVPSALKILYVRAYSAASSCKQKGTFVSCYEGNFRNQQLAVVVIKVQAKRKGTFEVPGKVFSQGVDDPNGGNNQLTETVQAYPS